MAKLDQIIEQLQNIDGAFAAAVSDYESGMSLAAESTRANFNAETAGALNGEVVKSKLAATKALGINQSIEDILITLGDQYHLIRLVPKTSLFVYLALDRGKANLAMARHKLKALESDLIAELGGN